MLDERAAIDAPTVGIGFTPATVSFGSADLQQCPLCERLALGMVAVSSLVAVGSCLLEGAGLFRHWPEFVRWAEQILAMG